MCWKKYENGNTIVIDLYNANFVGRDGICGTITTGISRHGSGTFLVVDNVEKITDIFAIDDSYKCRKKRIYKDYSPAIRAKRVFVQILEIYE